MFHTSVITISRSALEHNLKFIREMVYPARFSSVIKGNAYGHGIEHFVSIAEQCGIDHFSVFSADEAWRVLHASHHNPDIMIMGMIDNSQVKWAVDQGVEFFVFEIDRLEKAIEMAKKCEKRAKIHLELETGMNRTGLNNSELEQAISLLKDNKEHLELKGICTHYAGSESIANYHRIRKQIKQFRTFRKMLEEKEGIKAEYYHTACSAASVRYPETRMDLVRIGIMQFGFWPSREVFIEYISRSDMREDPLKRVMNWHSKVMSVKEVKCGEFVGYGTSYLAQKDMKIATVPVGYSHGFPRTLSNTGRLLINGSRVPVIGIVNMNALTVDVTDLKEVNKGDSAIIIGEQDKLELTVSSFAELSDQLNYESLARLPLDIPRQLID